MTGVLYASLLELKQTLEIADTASDVDLERALAGASRWIDHHTGRRFWLDSTDQTQEYYPTSSTRLQVVDLVSVTSIDVDQRGDLSYSTTLASTDYELWPLRESRFQEVRIWPTSSQSFSPGRRVRLVGRFGCVVEGVAPPVEVRQATLLLAGRYFKRREAPFGVLGAADLGQFERLSKDDPDVLNLLAAWSLNRSWILV